MFVVVVVVVSIKGMVHGHPASSGRFFWGSVEAGFFTEDWDQRTDERGNSICTQGASSQTKHNPRNTYLHK